MFAKYGMKPSTIFTVLCCTLFAASPIYGWQDFPSFEQIMREADLRNSGRVSNQPLKRPESSWPVMTPARRSETRSDRFTPSNRRDREGAEPSGRLPWSNQPTENNRQLEPRRSTIPDSNSGNRTGVRSGFENFSPTTGQVNGRSTNGRSTDGRSTSGQDSTFIDFPNRNFQNPSDSWPSESGSGVGAGVRGGRRDVGGGNSDLRDPFGNAGSRPSWPQPTSNTPLDRQQPNNAAADFMTLPPSSATSSSTTSSPAFIRPAAQSRPLSERGPGGSFRGGGSFQGSGFQDNGSESAEPLNYGSFGFGPGDNLAGDRGLDADFNNALPERGSLSDDRLNEDVLDADSSEFDWRTIRVSVGDIILSGNTIFQHSDSVLSIPEETAYLDLIQDIEKRKEALMMDPSLSGLSANARLAIWEECFYEFTKARQLAFRNGKLRHESKSARLRNGLADPFGTAENQQSLTSRENYVILDDIRRYPDHFTGRPIVLSGLFSPESDRTMSRTDGALDPTITTVEEDPAEPVVRQSALHGMVYDGENRLTKATVTTGSLTSAISGQLLATVDTSGLTTPRRGVQDIRSAWRNMPPFPVLIKGWVVKKFKGDRPLIYCESMRLLSPEPHRSLVQTHTYDKKKIRKEEKWLYYETIQQMNETRSDMQQELARQNVVERIDILQSEIIAKFKQDALSLKAKYSVGKVEQAEYEKQLGSLNRQFQMRKRRHVKYRSEIDRFPTYVDLFQNPEDWHGKMVTLKGHVRHSVTYDSDSTMYDGRPLYELWLFTEDSQHTPAVIITPELPADFPMDAEIVNQVSVTGCFFKRYVYAGQAERRIAPLILAGRVQWAPTVSHVASLVKSGDLSAGSPLAVRAKTLESKQSGNTALILISLVIIFGLMVLWGRAQREERDRLRLRDRIVHVKEIENGQPPEFASAADEYLNRIRVR